MEITGKQRLTIRPRNLLAVVVLDLENPCKLTQRETLLDYVPQLLTDQPRRVMRLLGTIHCDSVPKGARKSAGDA